jgi:hypothetical protein
MLRDASERVGGAFKPCLGVEASATRTPESSLQLAISFLELPVRVYRLVLTPPNPLTLGIIACADFAATLLAIYS